MPEEPQAGSEQDFSQAGLQLGCACRNRGTVGMGASKASSPGACWLSTGMAESSWEMEEKAGEKIIPAEMCSAPAVGLRGPRGMDVCPPSPSHPCTRAVHLQIFMGLLQRCLGGHPHQWSPAIPVAVPLLEGVPVPRLSNTLGGFMQHWSLLFHCPDQQPQCKARACKGRLLGWRALPVCLGVSIVSHPLGLLTHS